VNAIREAGGTPVQRNTFYEPIKVLAYGAPSANEAEPPSLNQSAAPNYRHELTKLPRLFHWHDESGGLRPWRRCGLVVPL
jgi:hypothetical protein